MKKCKAMIVGGALATLLVFMPQAMGTNPIVSTVPYAADQQTSMKHVSGTIRRTSPTTWAALNDTAHASIGISWVEYFPTKLRVHYDFVASVIHGVSITADETMAKNDIRAGASVNLTYMDIYIYKGASTTPVDPKTMTNASVNIWIQGDFTE